MTLIDDWLGQVRIGVVGLGYVGLPLAMEFSRRFPVIGFDRRSSRIAALRRGEDDTLEFTAAELAAAPALTLTERSNDLRSCNVKIVSVPTPVDSNNQPDFTPLLSATEAIGRQLCPGDIVIYESTVYPGCTENLCAPLLEQSSRLRYNVDFFCGYSPERINPGDRDHRLTTICKITSGSTPQAAERIDALYASIVAAGTYRAESIKIAEAAKVIENTQRDLNIALVNELAMICARLGIDTEAVLRAAETKWNFMAFRPGLVGGHCVGVDPYYLVHCAREAGHDPQVILAGRRTNDMMGQYIADRLEQAMADRRVAVSGSRILIMGLAFKENCPDPRNTKIIDIVTRLESAGASVDVFDPWVAPAQAHEEFGLDLLKDIPANAYDAIVLAVAHRQFRAMSLESIRAFGRRDDMVLFDVKHMLPPEDSDLRL